jgi:hypothetical protein
MATGQDSPTVSKAPVFGLPHRIIANFGAGVGLSRSRQTLADFFADLYEQSAPVPLIAGRERRYLSVTEAPRSFCYFSVGDACIIDFTMARVESNKVPARVSGTSLSRDTRAGGSLTADLAPDGARFLFVAGANTAQSTGAFRADAVSANDRISTMTAKQHVFGLVDARR